MVNSYRSRGLLPVIVGSAAIIVGAISTLTSLAGNSIVETGVGNGANSVASILLLVTGFLLIKNGTTYAAILYGALVISLLTYGNYRVDTERTFGVIAAAGSAAVNATSAAASSVSSAPSFQASHSQSNNGLHAGNRWLTTKELEWCARSSKNGQSKGCKTRQCPTTKCGVKGK